MLGAAGNTGSNSQLRVGLVIVRAHADNHYAAEPVTALCRAVFHSANSPHSKGGEPDFTTSLLSDSAGSPEKLAFCAAYSAFAVKRGLTTLLMYSPTEGA